MTWYYAGVLIGVANFATGYIDFKTLAVGSALILSVAAAIEASKR